MKKLRNIFADGIALLVPIGAAGYIIYKMLELLRHFIRPVADALDIQRFLGRFTLVILSLVALAIITLLLGLLMQSRWITHFHDRLEATMLRLFPPLYKVKVFFADQLKRENATSGWTPIILKVKDSYFFGYLVRETEKVGIFVKLKKNSVTEGDTEILEKGAYTYKVVDSNDLHMMVREFGHGSPELIEKVFSR